MFSILIPTYNNLEYLKTCINSIKKNSKFNHQIIVHVNEGSDGTLEFIKNNKIEYTFSNQNIGMPKALNISSKKSTLDYILISHDDFYYCPGWDQVFFDEIKKIKHNNFYLSGTMVGQGQIKFNAGSDVNNFDENKLLKNLNNIQIFDFQGTTKCPGLVHKNIWEKVGGWSEEFSPTGGDDTDFAMKLWASNIRIFKGLGKCSAYHFGSVTTRKKKTKFTTYLGSKGNKVFLKKWGYSINFFEKFYLKSGLDKNKNLILNNYIGSLKEPKKNIKFYFELLKCKIQLFYLYLIRYKF